MKKIAIFLHGKGQNPEWENHKPFSEIAKALDAEFISITARYPHRNGFRWHNAEKDPATISEYESSLDYIEESVKTLLTKSIIGWGGLGKILYGLDIRKAGIWQSVWL